MRAFETRALPLSRLADLRQWFAEEVEGDLPRAVHRRLRLTLQESELPSLPDGRLVRSLVVAALPQPFSRAVFTVGGKRLPFEIPPTYGSYDETMEGLRQRLQQASEDRFRFVTVRLPSKSLAVCSGLAAWGRNNIAYVNDWGSYLFLGSFVSDCEPDTEGWVGPSLLQRCESCIACARACPTGAIDGDRVLLHTERCLTFLNEGDDPFPEWLAASAHECPVGCLACQRACPENAGREVLGPVSEFSAAETSLLRGGVSVNDLDADLRNRLNLCGLLDYLPQLPRNLGVLLPPDASLV